jgi:hypothetical protein
MRLPTWKDALVGIRFGGVISAIAGCVLYVTSSTNTIRGDVLDLVTYGITGGIIGSLSVGGLFENPTIGAVGGSTIGMCVPIVRARGDVLT